MSRKYWLRLPVQLAALLAAITSLSPVLAQASGLGSQTRDHPEPAVIITEEQPFLGGPGPSSERVRPRLLSTYDLSPHLYTKWSKPRTERFDPKPLGTFSGSSGPITLDTSGGPEIAAPNLLRNWDSIGPNGWTVPAPNIAAGPYHILVVTNDDLAIYNKKGDLLWTRDFNNWLSDSRDLYSPRCFYDNHSQRFVIGLLMYDEGYGGEFESAYVVIVSNTNNAMGTWQGYYLDARLDSSTNTFNYAANLSIGYDSLGAVYLTSNQCRFTDGAFQYAKVRVLKKSEIYYHQPASWYDFWNLTDSGGTKTHSVRAAQCHSNLGVGLLVNSNHSSGNYLKVWEVFDPTGTPSLMGAMLPVGTYSFPPDGVQPGTSDKVYSGDARLLNAEYYNDYLYTAHSVSYDWGAGPRAVIRHYKIHIPGTPSVVWAEAFGEPWRDCFFPAVSVNSQNDVAVVFARSGETEYASIRYSGRRSGDSAMQSSALLKAGSGAYTGYWWGECFGIALDPADTQSFWTYGQYAKAGNTWGTWVGEVNFDRTPDASPPTWSNFSPTKTKDRTPNVTVKVQDQGWSGLDTASARYRISTDGGSTYGSWDAADCTGDVGTTEEQTVSVNNVPFNQDSLTDNLIQFYIEDMYDGRSIATYSVQTDGTDPNPWGILLPPQGTSQTPTLCITIQDATSGLRVTSAKYWYSRDHGRTSFGPFTASCTGKNGTTATQTVTATNVPFDQDSLTEDTVMFSIEDMFGNVSDSGWRVHEVDSMAPGRWAHFRPNDVVNGGSQTCTVNVRDLGSGLKIRSAQYRYSTNSGGSWSEWAAAACSGYDGTTEGEVITATDVPFDTPGSVNRIQFRIEDMFGNLGTSDPYTVTIDKLSLVEGSVVLKDYVGSLDGVPLTVKLYSGATLVETNITTLNATGNYSVWFANKDGTLVRVKAPTHLTESVATSLSSLVPNALNWTLRFNGDGDGNNEIGLPDLNLVLLNFTKNGHPADYNGNGTVDLLDLNLVLLNFAKSGS